jgi:putative transposase
VFGRSVFLGVRCPYYGIMNTPRCTDQSYIDFLVASQRGATCTEAARVQPQGPFAPAHDSFNRLLNGQEPEPERLWKEAEPLVEKNQGVLVLDDSTLDKPYAQKIPLVTNHWSGKHQKVVRGINLISLVWTDGDRKIPVDYRVYNKQDGLTKNDHFWEILLMAKARGFSPKYVLFDGWYASLENLKQIRDFGWLWLTRFKGNRKVSVEGRVCLLDDVPFGRAGKVLHLQGYGRVRVFRIDAPDGDTEYWATNDLAMEEGRRQMNAELGFAIENYHRELKQNCAVEKCQVRSEWGQRNHIGMAIRAFLRLEWHHFTTGISGFLAKTNVTVHSVESPAQAV